MSLPRGASPEVYMVVYWSEHVHGKPASQQLFSSESKALAHAEKVCIHDFHTYKIYNIKVIKVHDGFDACHMEFDDDAVIEDYNLESKLVPTKFK